MESRDVLKIHGVLRRYCTSRVSLLSTLEVQYLLNLPCIFNTSLDSILYLLNHGTVHVVGLLFIGYQDYYLQKKFLIVEKIPIPQFLGSGYCMDHIY